MRHLSGRGWQPANAIEAFYGLSKFGDGGVSTTAWSSTIPIVWDPDTLVDGLTSTSDSSLVSTSVWSTFETEASFPVTSALASGSTSWSQELSTTAVTTSSIQISQGTSTGSIPSTTTITVSPVPEESSISSFPTTAFPTSIPASTTSTASSLPTSPAHNSTITHSPPEGGESPALVTALSSVFGVLLFIALVIFLVWFIRRSKRRKLAEASKHSSDSETGSSAQHSPTDKSIESGTVSNPFIDPTTNNAGRPEMSGIAMGMGDKVSIPVHGKLSRPFFGLMGDSRRADDNVDFEMISR